MCYEQLQHFHFVNYYIFLSKIGFFILCLLILQAEITAEVEKFCDVLGAYKDEVCLVHFSITFYKAKIHIFSPFDGIVEKFLFAEVDFLCTLALKYTALK